MNMNSLVIVAGAARARMFRTAKTASPKVPVELLELDAMEASANDARGGGAAELADWARQIAMRASQFAHYHFCNPILVVASEAVSAAILAELERALPNVPVRRLPGDYVELRPHELMPVLQEQAAFEPWPDRELGQIAL
ncbi:MAG TPA: hypothetical protein VMG12_17775 [Polyangiaceae bacterium]|nr:hypothetical protein [Polyangiaceae bacterium]